MPKIKNKKSKSSKSSKNKNDDHKKDSEQSDNDVIENVADSTIVDLQVNDVIEDVTDSTIDNMQVKDVETKSEKMKTDRGLISLLEHHQSVLMDIKKLLTSELKAVQELKKVAKQETKKKRKKRSNSSGKSTNSGIMRKFKIPKKLTKFMGTSIASRVDVLKKISAYVREKDLQDENDKRYIDLDSSLLKLFPELKNKEGDDRLCFTSIMTHISKYFPKKGDPGYKEALVEIEIVEEDNSKSKD